MPPISKEGKTKEEIYKEMSIKHLGCHLQYSRMDVVYEAMDTYMKECVLDAFSFLAKHSVECEVDTEGVERFYYKGEMITKEALFQNFL